jgi:hypothetical protein
VIDEERHEVPCPIGDCHAVIKVRRDLPPGTYPCICHAGQLQVSWTTHADFSRHPALRAVDG